MRGVARGVAIAISVVAVSSVIDAAAGRSGFSADGAGRHRISRSNSADLIETREVIRFTNDTDKFSGGLIQPRGGLRICTVRSYY